MAVQDFIPIRDVKKTTEREEKYKPSIAELTKIEVPGRPVPASFLEDEASKVRKKKGTKRRSEKKTPSKIEQPKRDSILILTEKPQAANKIASSLGIPRKVQIGKVSYYELERDNKKIIVASAVGHLFNLNYVKGQKGWPIFKLEWVPSHEKKSAEFTKAYFDTLKKLEKKAESLIIATDYDIEGEVIGWNVLRYIFKKDTAKRMKYSTLTKDELIKSYENLLPTPDWGQAYAGETRHILDWLYGINLSRALMSAIKTSGSFKLLSIGRVQGPSLKIIVNRENEILNFKSVPFWQILAEINGFNFKHPKDIFEKKELEKFRDIDSGVAETKESKENIIPPYPFDLTTLQREAYRIHRISPSQTLSTAQKLYLDGLISYPRTSSQKIPPVINTKDILKKLEKFFPEVENATRSNPIEGKKDDPAHPAIYPTGDHAYLDSNFKKIYDLIVKRFVSLFSPDAITSNKRVKIKSDKDPNITFTASGLSILEKGWTSVYPSTIEERDVPTLNGPVKIDKINENEKETQPPKRYTPTSLITLLEKMNLGTKSTRSMIVDTLFNRGYLDGKSIKATPLGMRLIESLEKYSPIIIDENLTRSLEDEMEKILISKSDFDKKEKEVIAKAERLITDISKEFKSKEIEIGKEILKGVQDLRENEYNTNIITQCPTCKKGELQIRYSKKTKRNFIGCSAYPECTQTYSLPPNSLIKKSDKLCTYCAFPKLLIIKRARKPWELCFNPNCEVNIKRREEWEQKQKNNQKYR